MFLNSDLIVLLLSIGTILIVARLISELGNKFQFPIVMGELLVGILLGPSVFGNVNPLLYNTFFPKAGAAKIALDGITSLAVILLMFVAGMEMQTKALCNQRRVALYTSFTSIVIPFAFGFSAVWYVPQWFNYEQCNLLTYALFFGTVMSISAIPVIAKILLDLNIYRTKIGQVIMAAAVVDDLVGWFLFSLVVALMGSGDKIYKIFLCLSMISCFGMFMLFIGRHIIDSTLPWIQSKLSFPGGVLSLSLGLCFFSAAFTESIGLNAIIGAFIIGIAFGNSVHLNEKVREIINMFVTNIFAPLFFVSLGLTYNFVDNFDVTLITIVLILAVVSKLAGAYCGAYFGGMGKREALVVGVGLNVRGTMVIILGIMAHNAGIINEKMVVALIVMSLLTSIVSGPLIRKLNVGT